MLSWLKDDKRVVYPMSQKEHYRNRSMAFWSTRKKCLGLWRNPVKKHIILTRLNIAYLSTTALDIGYALLSMGNYVKMHHSTE